MSFPLRPALSLVLVSAAASLFACSGEDPLPYHGANASTGGNAALGADGTPVPGTGTPSPGAAPTNEVTGTRTEVVCTPGCTDEPYSEGWSCEAAKANCGEDWFAGACERTCGVCSGDEEEICTEVVVSDPATPANPSTPSNPANPTPPSSGGGTTRPPGADAPPPVSGGQRGWASRYWDCCMQHCSWEDHSPGNAANVCDGSNNPTTQAAGSACSGGGGHTCWSMAPWAVSDTLAYGYAATPPGGQCGQCYQLDFTGTGEHTANDPGSKTLAGKTMIVQATNIGHDVNGNQFDLLIPGGGVGAFNACSQQWGVSDLGAQYGGFLTACNEDVGCLRDKCESTFAGKPDLLNGCLFHADWMGGANNPQFTFAPVACPAALEQTSGMTD